MDTISPCPHYVYALRDPRDNDSIFYVGITVSLYKRYKQHICCDGTNPAKDQRIQEILAAGHLPLMYTIEQVASFDEALAQEQYWIRQYHDLGYRLVNAQVQEAKGQKCREPLPRPFPCVFSRRSGRRNAHDGTRQLFELWWDERKPNQSFGDFFKDDLSDDMSADGWGYYPRHYISRKGRSHATYVQWQREWRQKIGAKLLPVLSTSEGSVS